MMVPIDAELSDPIDLIFNPKVLSVIAESALRYAVR
jgi:hypothetical protein